MHSINLQQTFLTHKLSLGIGGCLSVGSNAAKSLAAALGKPLVGVHHMVRSHVLFLSNASLIN